MFNDGALWDAVKRLQRDLKCRQRCLGISSSGDPTLFLNQQGDWVSASGGGLTFDNGLTLTGSNVKLGGNIIEDTILSADPTTVVFGFGDLGSEKIFGVGNTNADGKFMKLLIIIEMFQKQLLYTPAL